MNGFSINVNYARVIDSSAVDLTSARIISVSYYSKVRILTKVHFRHTFSGLEPNRPRFAKEEKKRKEFKEGHPETNSYQTALKLT